jgi:hypothetical protein
MKEDAGPANIKRLMMLSTAYSCSLRNSAALMFELRDHHGVNVGWKVT